jgi:hypothetical protein
LIKISIDSLRISNFLNYYKRSGENRFF